MLPKHGVLIGDNNTGKTTLLEAIDLVLGPDRLNRTPPIDEHDFFQGKYVATPAIVKAGEVGQPVAPLAAEAATNNAEDNSQAVEHGGTVTSRIEVAVTIIDLTEEQKSRFGDYTEFWDTATNTFYDQPDPAGVDAASITEALRVTFRGWYDLEEDDFDGKTYFTRSLLEGGRPRRVLQEGQANLWVSIPALAAHRFTRP